MEAILRKELYHRVRREKREATVRIGLTSNNCVQAERAQQAFGTALGSRQRPFSKTLAAQT